MINIWSKFIWRITMLSRSEIQDRYNAAQAKADKWIRIQINLSNSKDHLASNVVSAIEEIIMNEVKFVTDMQRLNNLVVILRDHVSKQGGSDKKEQIAILDIYIEKLDTLLSTYAAMPDLLKLINDDGTGATPEELIEKIGMKLLLPESKQIMTQLGDLADQRMNVEMIHKLYLQDLSKLDNYLEERTSEIVLFTGTRSTQKRAFSDFTIMPAQNLPRIYMPVEQLSEKLSSFAAKAPDYHIPAYEKPTTTNSAIQKLINNVSEGIDQAKNSVQAYNSKKAAIQNAEEEFSKIAAKTKIREKQAVMLRNILGLNINTSLQTTSFFSEYLKTALTKTYPEMFQLNIKGEVDIILPTSNVAYTDIHKALGYELNTTLTLEPSRFDAQILDKLYQKTENPLWIVLKSTKPVNENFSAEQKIHAYKEIAQAFKDKKIGNTGKYLAAYNLTQSAKAVAQEHPESIPAFNEAFGYESTLGKWVIEKAKNKDTVISNLIIRPAKLASLEDKATDFEIDERASFGSTISLNSSLDSISDSGIDTFDEESSVDISDIDEFDSEKQQVEDKPSVHQFNTDLENKKSLLIASGIEKMMLTSDEKQRLTEEINNAETSDALKIEEEKVFAVVKLCEVVKTVTDSLRKRKDFFSRSSEKKVDEILGAFKKLTLDEKIELVEYILQIKQDKSNKKEDSNIGRFLEKLNQNRALISLTKETTSFKQFKEQMQAIKYDTPDKTSKLTIK
ncbi:hypothetical protein [Legionella sp.]|uniref:hypothetical protein n=1 Tax=Legionella sp. TaxID=459 RepID=UPI003CB075E8